MIDANYFEILEAIFQPVIAFALFCISDRLEILCRIFCGRKCEMEESDE